MGILRAKIVVITGTDTGVGKTLVGAGLAFALSRQGKRVIAVKPVESGCRQGVSSDEDGAILAEAAGQADPKHALVRLRAPLAPPVAAALEGCFLDMDAWCAHILEVADAAEVVLVEGAGGLLSPLTWKETTRDLARRLGARALVVASDRLGTLNHTLLTLEVLAASNIPVGGIVFSAPESPDESTGRNADSLRRFAEIDRAVTVPRVTGWREASEHLEEVARWILS